ncbi:MAG: Rieske 2Fe-2S domain-containing protein [Candidatus Dormibacteraeota bacterium]|nr:Rieske 2Fe-2S domain-containing protein [Candidatus Dormibacteraeota bacterium]
MPETLIERVVRRQSWLEPLSDFTQKLASGTYKVLGPMGPPLRNFMHGTWILRHPLHPALTDIPIGAWTVGVVADYVAHFTARIPESAGDIALTIGLVVSLLTLGTGYTDFIDTFALERRFGCAHGMLMSTVVLVYASSFFLRWFGSESLHPLAVGLSTGGYALVLLGSWIGGHVVFGIGYNVNRSAFIESGPEDWTAAGSASAVPGEGMILVEVGGMKVMLARDQGKICALSDICTHAGGPLHEGTLSNGVVTCPWHASRFRVRDGHTLGGPATMDLPQLLVRETDGQVQVKLTEKLHEP